MKHPWFKSRTSTAGRIFPDTRVRHDDPLSSSLHQPDRWYAIHPQMASVPMTEILLEEKFQLQLERVFAQTDEFTADALSAWLDEQRESWMQQISKETEESLRTQRWILSHAASAHVEARKQLEQIRERVATYELRVAECTRILAGRDEHWSDASVVTKLEDAVAEDPYVIPAIDRPDLRPDLTPRHEPGTAAAGSTAPALEASPTGPSAEATTSMIVSLDDSRDHHDLNHNDLNHHDLAGKDI